MTELEIKLAKAAKTQYMREYQRQRRKKDPKAVQEADLRYWLKRARREAIEREQNGKEGAAND